MRGGILCSLLLAILILIFAGMNQENSQSGDLHVTVLDKSSESGKKRGAEHSVSMVAPELNDLGHKTIPVDDKPKEYESRYGDLPHLLRGTSVDGELLVDTEGKFLMLPSVRNRFDYFLSAVSEEGLETVIGRVEENIIHSLPSEAAEEALDVFYSYINYKKGLQDYLKDKPDFPENSDQLAGIRKIIEKRVELRRKYMAPEVVDSFFGDQEHYDEFSLKSLEIHYDTSLTSEEKQNELTRLEQTLPEKIQDRRKREKEIEVLSLR